MSQKGGKGKEGKEGRKEGKDCEGINRDWRSLLPVFSPSKYLFVWQAIAQAFFLSQL